jgi:hypothetical protein
MAGIDAELAQIRECGLGGQFDSHVPQSRPWATGTDPVDLGFCSL